MARDGGLASLSPPYNRDSSSLHLDHVEVALRRAALRTDPVLGNVSPSGARRQPFIGVAFFLVIDVTAGPALPGFVGLATHWNCPRCRNDMVDRWPDSGTAKLSCFGNEPQASRGG